jgi:hypothetical protein
MLRNCKIVFSAANTKQKYEIFFVNKLIETFPSASNSVLMSTAAYLVYKFPTLPHPRLMKDKLPHNRIDQSEQSPYLSLHPLFDEWVDTFVESVLKGNACRFGSTLYLKVNVQSEYADLLKGTGWEFQVNNTDYTVY